MKNIHIKNQTGNDAKIIIKQDPKVPLSIGTDSTLTFILKNSGDSSSTRIIYGFGIFSKDDLYSFNTMIKQITIETQNDTCKIRDETLIHYLPKKRKGLLNNTIELNIRNCPKN